MSYNIHPKYQPLFQPITLANGVQLSNRLSLHPITTNASSPEGYITSDETAYASRRSLSAPLQVTTAAYVDDSGQLFEFGPSIKDDRYIPGLAKLAQAMKQDGAKTIIQLTHAGRFSKVTLEKLGHVYGPSPMHLKSPIEHDVKEMSLEMIQHIIEQYGQATRRAIEAGFDGVEISNAQRLLPQQFFSPFSNQRTDEYGPQSLENRARFGVQIMERVQKVIDHYADDAFILGFRGTPEETRGHQIGYTIEEFNQYVDWMMDVSHLSYYAIASWGHDIYKETVRAGKYQGQLVNAVIHQHFSGRLPIIATGGINHPDKALEALRHADMVGMSSVFVTEPDFVTKLREGRQADIDLSLHLDALDQLAIPPRAFKDLVEFMDYGGSLPEETRDAFRQMAAQTDTSYFQEFK